MGLALPTLVLLALARGRRALSIAVAGGLASFAAIGMWGYVSNYDHGGDVLGAGTAIYRDAGHPAYPRSVANAFYLLYGLMDDSVLSNRLVHLLALAGAVLGLAVAAWWFRGRRANAAAEGAAVALPFLAPLLVVGGAGAVAWGAARWGFPIRGPRGIVAPLEQDLSLQYGRIANEDYSAFGPVGIVALLAACGLAFVAFARRRVDARHLVLATALPLFLVLISLWSTWVPFLIRFFLLPAALSAPLLAVLFRHRAAGAAYLVLAALVIGLTLVHWQARPLDDPYGFGLPWDLTQTEAMRTTGLNGYAASLAAYDRVVPPGVCVGVGLARWDPTYVLYGPRFRHRILFVDMTRPLLPQVARLAIPYLVVTKELEQWQGIDELARVGWRLEPLGSYWVMAVSPRTTNDCQA